MGACQELMTDGSFKNSSYTEFQKKAFKDFGNNKTTPIIPGVQQYYILVGRQANKKERFQVKEAFCDGERII
jgi:hypothetical protein